MSSHAVGRVHEDLGNAASLFDGLQLEPQQVPLDAVSFERLNTAEEKVKTPPGELMDKATWSLLT